MVFLVVVRERLGQAAEFSELHLGGVQQVFVLQSSDRVQMDPSALKSLAQDDLMPLAVSTSTLILWCS